MVRLILLLGIFLLFISGTCLALDKDLVAYWTFDEGAGQTIKMRQEMDTMGSLSMTPNGLRGNLGKHLNLMAKPIMPKCRMRRI